MENKQTAIDYLIQVFKVAHGDSVTDLVKDEIFLVKRLETLQMQDMYVAGGKAAFNATKGREFQTFEEYFEKTYKNQ